MSKNKIENNPHYQSGYFWGKNMGRHIKNTEYKTLENAILSKQELIEDLKKNFGWNDTDKDVAETMGIVKALEDAQEKELELKGHNLTIEDVAQIAEDMGVTITEEQIFCSA